MKNKIKLVIFAVSFAFTSGVFASDLTEEQKESPKGASGYLWDAAGDLYNAASSGAYAVGNLAYDAAYLTAGTGMGVVGLINVTYGVTAENEKDSQEYTKSAISNFSSAGEYICKAGKNVPNTLVHTKDFLVHTGKGLVNLGYAGYEASKIMVEGGQYLVDRAANAGNFYEGLDLGNKKPIEGLKVIS